MLPMIKDWHHFSFSIQMNIAKKYLKTSIFFSKGKK